MASTSNIAAVRTSRVSAKRLWCDRLPLSWLLSTKVTAAMLNNFTADGKVAHRFPFVWSRAFCQSTGDWRLLHYIAEQASFILLDKEDADVVALGEQVIEQERAAAEVKKIARNIIDRRASR